LTDPLPGEEKLSSGSFLVPPHHVVFLEEDPTMVRASWNGSVLAESERTIVVEGNHYFPPEAIKTEHFRPSPTHTTCPWKGVASYYSVEVAGKSNPDAAWFYPNPKDAAKNIAGYIAFWKGVEVRAS
jgi:uncharacterized protein (DUF427 family)